MFVGRRDERAWLSERLEGRSAGRGGVVLISGPPGIGKTTLVREVARSSAPLWARSWEFGDAPALWPIVQLVRPLARRLPEVFEPYAGSLAPVLDPRAEQAPVQQLMLYQAFADAVAEAGNVEPLLLVVDDLHAADHSTLQCLTVAQAAWRWSAVLLVATRRTRDTRTSPDRDRLLARIAQDADERVLGGLSPVEVAALVERRLGRVPRAEEMRRVLARAGGVPLFVEGLLAGGSLDRDAGLPPDLRQTLVDRIRCLPAPTRVLLERACLARERFTTAQLAETTGRCPAEIAPALTRAVDEGLLASDSGTFAWTHQLYAEAAESTLSAQATREGHLAWLRVLAGDGHVAACAEHAVAAGDPSAAERLMAAGRVAAARGGFTSAAELYERAALAFEAPRDKVRAQLARAWALQHGGDARGARETVEAALRIARREDADPAVTVPEVACAMADMVHFALQDARAMEVLSLALDLAAPEDHLTRARLLLRRVTRFAEARLEDIEATVARAATEARRSENAQVMYDTLHASMSVWRADRLAARVRALEQLESLAGQLDLPAQFQIARWAFNTGLERCDGQAARDALCRMERLAGALQTPRARFVVLLRQVTIWQLEGQFDRIDPVAVEAAARRASDPHAGLFGATCIALRAVLQGDRDTVRAIAPRAYDVLTTAWPHHPAVALQGAWIQLHAGDDDVVDAVYLRWRERRFHAEPWWSYLQGLAICADIAMARDDREAAEWVLDAMAPYPDGYAGCGPAMPFGPLAVFEARLLQWLGRDATAALGRARRLSERLGAPAAIACLEREHAGTASAPHRATGDMSREGDVWCFRWAGREVRLRASKGLGYLAVVVARDGEPVHVLELTSGDQRNAVDGDAGPVLDARARDAYAERVRSLYADLAEAEAHHDLGRVDRLTMELDALTEELARATGLGGRDRRAASNAERARSAVKQALRRALKALRRDVPELADHLERSVETGQVCRYRPEPGGTRLALRRTP